MKVPKDLLLKFPAVFRQKLESGEVLFPDEGKFLYEPIFAYRCIKRKKDDNSSISRADFLSPAEEGRIVKGIKNIEKRPEYYGASLFQNEKELYLKQRLPKKNRKIIKGYIVKECGPQLTSEGSSHVCWWVYEDARIEGFEVEE